MNKFTYMWLVLLTTLLMGSAFPIGKIGLTYAPPFFLMSIRFILAGGLLAVIVTKKFRPIIGKQWLKAALIGLFQSTLVGLQLVSPRSTRSRQSVKSSCLISKPTLINGKYGSEWIDQK